MGPQPPVSHNGVILVVNLLEASALNIHRVLCQRPLTYPCQFSLLCEDALLYKGRYKGGYLIVFSVYLNEQLESILAIYCFIESYEAQRFQGFHSAKGRQRV